MAVALQLIHISFNYLLGLGQQHIGTSAAAYCTSGCCMLVIICFVVKVLTCNCIAVLCIYAIPSFSSF